MTTTPSPANSPAELDILQRVAVLMPCKACGQQYPVSLRDILVSQEMIHLGCPARNETECLPLTYSSLADEAAVREFEQSWNRLSSSVRAAGLTLIIQRPILSH